MTPTFVSLIVGILSVGVEGNKVVLKGAVREHSAALEADNLSRRGLLVREVPA